MTTIEFEVKRIDYQEIREIKRIDEPVCEVDHGSLEQIIKTNKNSSVTLNDKKNLILILFGNDEKTQREELNFDFAGYQEIIELMKKDLEDGKKIYFSKTKYFLDTEYKIMMNNKCFKIVDNWKSSFLLASALFSPVFLYGGFILFHLFKK